MSIHYQIKIFLVMVAVIGGSVANGSGIGGITGPGTGIGSNDTGLRELVPLMPKGNLLIGRPVVSKIALIIIDAPTLQNTASHIILRELNTSEGVRSLLLSASDTLKSHLRRVTIYIKDENSNMVLLEQHGEAKKRHLPQVIQSTEIHNSPVNHTLLAFSLKRFGLYWISAVNTSGKNNTLKPPIESTARTFLGGGISRGLLPWGLSALALIIVMSLSYWVHAAENHRNK